MTAGPERISGRERIVWTDQAKADVRSIEQPIAIQILKTLGRYVLTGEGATKQLKGVTPPMLDCTPWLRQEVKGVIAVR
ncbi:MAG: hypothetical protein IPM24_16525 [Bryobacterales bacterium]|nr:hypothetical protein [Bryobacterales bacterium]